MNRIEQVATPAFAPAPAQQPQPRLPRSRAAVRRRAAQALLRPIEGPARPRRGTSGLAVAIAALAVPLIPSTALGAVSSTGSTPEAPQSRHHLHHGHVVPDPGAMTVQAWSTASGWSSATRWSVTVDGRYVPWPAEPGGPIDHPRPVVFPDGTHGEIAAYRVSHAGPRTDDPDAPGTQSPADPTSPNGSMSSTPPGDAPPEWSSGGPSAFRTARSHVVPEPFIPSARPANTKQMMVASAASLQAADVPNGTLSRPSAPERVVAAVDTSESPCLRTAYPVGSDPHMVAHLRPTTDTMDVVVTHHRTACAVRVDYLSQARA